MKIAFFHNLPAGGALRTVYEQIHLLSKYHSIDLYKIDNVIDKGVKIYCQNIWIDGFDIENNYPSVINRIVRDYRNFVTLRSVHKKIAKRIDSNNYNVVIVHSDRWTESPFILRYLKTKNIYHCHELLRIAYEDELSIEKNLRLINRMYEIITRYIRKVIDKNNARCADYIITSSQYIKEKVESVYKKKAACLHTGVDTNKFKSIKNIKKDIILYIGGRSKLKGFYMAQKAYKSLKSERYKFVSLGYGKGDKYVGNTRELVKYYNRALATLCPAMNEPFGLIPLESMACETPVLALNEGGYKETVINGETGFLLSRDPYEFTKKMKFIIQNPLIARKMGKKGRRHVIKNFTWTKHVSELEQYLIKLGNEKKCINSNS